MIDEWPGLHGTVEVHESLDEIDALVERFEIFEALHHRQTICNPMTSDELDHVIQALEFASGSRLLDIACGSGELMMRVGERLDVDATGLDLSPWMLNAAATRCERRDLADDARLRWVLCDAKHWPVDDPVDVATCLGADWIWHGTKGTIAAMAARVAVGGRIAIGSPRLHFDTDPGTASAQFGVLDTADDIGEMLEAHDLEIIERVDPDDVGWDGYMERCIANAEEWLAAHPGPRAEKYLGEARDWAAVRERDRSIIGWSVWVARRRT